MPNQNTLSPTARALLTAAVAHPSHAAILPAALPVAAQRAVARSMLKAGLVEEVPAESAEDAWRTEAGEGIAVRATGAGLAAIGRVEAAEPECAPATSETMQDPPMPAPATADADVTVSLPPPHGPQRRLQAAAVAVMAAWDTDGHDVLPDAMAALREVLVHQPRPQRRTEPQARAPRADTKQAGVLPCCAVVRAPAARRWSKQPGGRPIPFGASLPASPSAALPSRCSSAFARSRVGRGAPAAATPPTGSRAKADEPAHSQHASCGRALPRLDR